MNPPKPSIPTTAAPSTGGSINGGTANNPFLWTPTDEDLELTSAVFSVDLSLYTGTDAYVRFDWLDGEGNPSASAFGELMGPPRTYQVAAGKHFQSKVTLYTGDTGNISIALPVDTLITRNTRLQMTIVGDGSMADITVGKIRYRMRRDRDRTELQGNR